MRPRPHLALLLALGCASAPLDRSATAPREEHHQEAPKVCTLIGCVTGMTLMTIVPESPELLRVSRIRVCRNSTCLTHSLAELPPGKDTRLAWPAPPTGPFSPSAEFQMRSLPDGRTGLLVYYDSGSDTAWREDDVFTVTLTSADGRRLLDLKRPARYDKVEPNGPGCGTCYRAIYRESEDWLTMPR
ncbi:hypothetical protein [Corallococcus carmarthensis]|uniref:hypothetical protein n=1 Tax=Corallococcus carmarthensis TaxID=2316728 RepID=UPI0011C38395|nr:hypothetical protein [Corallococcus carmarthensis]